MSDHQHSFRCLEEIGGHLVCRKATGKKLRATDFPPESYAASVLSTPARLRPTLLAPKKKRPHGLDEPQVRFNSGYHDAAMDARHGWEKRWKSPHFDPVYEAGYWKGKHVVEMDNYTGDSTKAWEEYTEGRAIVRGGGSLQTRFYLHARRYDSREGNYDATLGAYKRWMDLVKIGSDPSTAANTVREETGENLHSLDLTLLGNVRRAQKTAPAEIHLILVSESPTGKVTSHSYEIRGMIK